MPELAEVEFYRKEWDPGLGEKVKKVHLHTDARPLRDLPFAKMKKAIAGTVFESSTTHGKQMLFRFQPDIWLGVHLGMTGKLLVADAKHKPEKHDHLVLFLPSLTLVFRDPRKFGRIKFHHGSEAPSWWADLPPEVLDSEFTKQHLVQFLDRHSKSPIKPQLLNQDGFPGIGNWMADEVLWRTRLHPATLCGEIPAKTREALWKELRKLCREAMKVIGTDWGTPPDSWLFNHRWKDGGFCPRCDDQLVRADLRGRMTCWCAKCQ